MRIDCERCGAAYRIPDAAVGAAGIRAECPRCGHQQVVGAQAPAAAVGASTAPSGGSTGGVDPLDLFDPAAPPREDLFDLSAPVNRPQDTGATVTVQDDDDPFAALPDEEVRGGGAVPPPSPAPPAGAPGGAREELPGAVGGGPRPRPTPTPRPAASPPKAPKYRIKKPDGRILGPVDFAELERMAQSGDLAPGDQVARNDDEFRLMSQYGEVAPLLAQAARNYQVRTAVVAAGPLRSKLGLVLGALVLLGAGGAVALYVFAPGLLPREVRAPVDALFAPEPQAIPNPVEADVPLFQMQALGAEEEAGPAGEGARVAARRALDEDTAEGYRRAVQLLKRRLVEAPDDTRAIGLLILATGYASRWKPRPQVVQRLLRYADYLKEVQDPSPEALLGRAAARYLLGPAAAPEARQLARQALAAAPDDIQVKLMLARALARIDHEAAVARLKALRKVAADAPRVWLDLGEACLAAGDFACAERAFSERLKATPGHAEAAEALASLYVKLGRFDAARTMYERILQDDPMRADADLMVAVVDYQGQGRLEAAERRLEALLDKADLVEARTVHLARTHLAAVYRLLGRAEAAKAQVERVLEADPVHPPASYQDALLALEEEDVERARERMVSAAAAMDRESRRLELKAMYAFARGEPREAARLARESSEAAPDRLEPMLMAVAFEGAAGRPRQAYLLLKQVLTLDPGDARRVRELTSFYDGQVAPAMIVRGMDALVAADPKQGLAHAARGIALYHAGELRAAQSALKKALELDEENLAAYVYLGVMARDAGDLAAAERAFRRAIEADKLAPLPRYLLGRTLEARGQTAKAREVYRQVLRLNPAHTLAEVRLAVLEGKAGRKKLRDILGRRPDSIAARIAMYEAGRR